MLNSLRYIQSHPEFKDISQLQGLSFDLRYATTNNFTGENVYGEFNRFFLHEHAVEKLVQAVENLQQKFPKYKFLIFDALRPRSAQRILFAKVKGTAQEIYVADPDKGSMHNYGMALDLTVLNESGKELDMGTEFDFFGELAQPKLEEKFLRLGILSPEQFENRLILRNAMVTAGFLQLPHEWWHFNALPVDEVKKSYFVVE